MGGRYSIRDMLIRGFIQRELDRHTPEGKTLMMDCLLGDARRKEQSIVDMLRSFDSELGTDLEDDAVYIYKQMDILRNHLFDKKPSLDAIGAGQRLINQLAVLDGKFRKQKDYYTPECFMDTVAVILEEAVGYMDAAGLDKLADYPDTIEEFYSRYGG